MQRIISISGGKGGVGKSNIALGLSVIYSKVKKGKVLLLDGDLGLGKIGILVGMHVSKDLTNVLRGECALEDIIYHYQGLAILPCGSGIAHLANLDSVERKDLLTNLKSLRNYEVIIIDTAAGIGENVLQFLKISTDIVMVVSSEMVSIMDCYYLIKTLVIEENQQKINIGTIINMVSSKIIADSRFTVLNGNCFKFLKKKIHNYGYVNRHAAVERAVAKQCPFIIGEPNSLPSNQLKTSFLALYHNPLEFKSKKSLDLLLEKGDLYHV